VPEYTEIKIRGHLDPHWAGWFAGLKLTQLEGNETLFSGSLPDQAALHGVLERVRDLNLRLMSVTCGDASTALLSAVDYNQDQDTETTS
jgi:hypothetical protein